MVGTAFFRSSEDKCPKCGAFGDETDEVDIGDGMVCPVCDTVFNKYMVLDEGKEHKMRNN